jgi:hypothetical protein
MRNTFLLSLFAAGLALGQAASDPLQIGDVTFTGSLRARIYDWDWFTPTDAATTQYNKQYFYSGNIARFNFSEKGAKVDWDAEFAMPVLLGLPTTATAPAPQGALGLGSNYYAANGNEKYTANFFPKQLYLRLKALGSEASALQIGRFEFNDGMELATKNASLAYLKANRIGQRLIGTFGFSDVGRSFDGVHYSYTKSSDDFTFVGAVPTRGVFQTDGWGWNKVAFGYGAYTHDWGHGHHAADTRFFMIDYDDWRDTVLKTDNRSAAVRRTNTENIHIQTYGANSAHVFTTSAGIFDALGWGVYQGGRWGTQTQSAYALDFEAGYQPTFLALLKPWIRGGYTVGSGDGNLTDKTHGTFFQLLPTPRPYARFPFFNMMNTEDRYGALLLRPVSRITISSEAHALRLTNANDLWYSGGGVYQPWTFGYTGRSTSGRRSLANLYDTSLEFRASRAITFTAYYGFAQGLAAMEKVYPLGKNGQFGYVEMAFKF